MSRTEGLAMPTPTPPPATAGTHSDSRADLPHRVHQQADDAAASVCMVVCYLRTANAGTAGQRLPGRQRAKLEHEAAGHGWRVAAWIEDLHQSGTTLARPGLHQALALLTDHQADWGSPDSSEGRLPGAGR
jgi:hypothetical protein